MTSRYIINRRQYPVASFLKEEIWCRQSSQTGHGTVPKFADPRPSRKRQKLHLLTMVIKIQCHLQISGR
jgi:hypothetical protein